MILQLITLLSIIKVASPLCDVVIESVYNNSKSKNGSWHAVNKTTVVLSEHEKTIWSVELYPLPLYPNSASFKVKKAKSQHLKGLYLCVKNETYISLCKKDNKNELDKYHRAFEFSLRKGKTFMIKSMDFRAINRMVHYGKDIGDRQALFDLNDDDAIIERSKWKAVVLDGCYGIFRPTTPAPSTTTTTSTTPTTTPTTTSTTPTTTTTTATTSTTTVSIERREKEIGKKVDVYLKNVSLSQNTSTQDILDIAEKIENYALDMASSLQENQTVEVKKEELSMKVTRTKLPTAFEQEGTFIGLNGNANKGATGAAMVIYEKYHLQIKDILKIKGGENETGFRMNSKMISAVIEKKSNLNDVEIRLNHVSKPGELNDVVCAFWNSSRLSSGGFWSTKGCAKVTDRSNENFTTCSCNHLTNFAILIAVNDFQVSGIHKEVLSKLSLACCCVSIAFLMIGIVLFLVLLTGERRHGRYVIHFNLMIALVIAQVTFITGIEAVQNKVACTSVAIILHYFLLASFAWMLTEGLYLYFAVIKVFNDGKTKLWYYFVGAWIAPLVVVIVTAAVNIDWYGTAEYCWFSREEHAQWAFMGPIIAVIVINFGILVLLLKQIIALSNGKGLMADVKVGIRSSVILLPILGITWIFGFLTFNSDTIAFKYIFAITNSLQGFLVTLFHCVLNGEVRNALKRKLVVWTNSSSLGNYLGSFKSFRSSDFSNSFSKSSGRTTSTVGSNRKTPSAMSSNSCSSLPLMKTSNKSLDNLEEYLKNKPMESQMILVTFDDST